MFTAHAGNRTWRFALLLALSSIVVSGLPVKLRVLQSAEPLAAEGIVGVPEGTIAATDWPWWRGPHRNGIAPASARPPVEWSESKNLLWKTPIPGRGHSSPTVVGKRVFLTTADEVKKRQLALCFDRATGKLLWQVQLHQGGFDHNNKKNSFASSTIACDGQRLFVVFWNQGAIWTTALDLQGERLWQVKVADFVSHQGYSASPVIYRNLVVVAADSKGKGTSCLLAMDRQTGKQVWQIKRPKMPNYVSPIIFKLAGKDQLLMAGCELMSGFDPRTGKVIWECPGSTTECVGSVVASQGLVFASGGYPKHETLCVRADGSNEILWRNRVKVYVPSLLAYQGYVYAVTDNGVTYCWEARTGKEMWKDRLPGGFSASPMLAAGLIYITSEQGKTLVFKPHPKRLEIVASNSLGQDVFASAVFSGEDLFLRTTFQENGRQEYLCCLRNVPAR
jgi:outer membrane protein assembly factor BamB